ncbi:porin OmpL, partial [Salmonella enterica subsp. enterica serovar Enteritidis]|nr:porin OmpL [Salmonella enterica subsp. enterica serovar Enteritidis]
MPLFPSRWMAASLRLKNGFMMKTLHTLILLSSVISTSVVAGA